MSDIRCISKDVLTNFIYIYKKHPALWKVKSNEYKNRNLKNKGYDELVEFYKQYDPRADRESVSKKIQSLRGSFRKELKKVEKSKRSGMSPDDIYVPSLWYYELLSFTIGNEQPTDSLDNFNDQSMFSSEDNNEQNEDELEVIREPLKQEEPSESVACSSRSTRKTMKRKARQMDHVFLKACTAALQSSKSSNDEDHYDVFGKYVSHKMKSIKSEDQRLFAEGLINQALQKAALHKLNENSIILENPTSSNRICVTPSSQAPQDFNNYA